MLKVKKVSQDPLDCQVETADLVTVVDLADPVQKVPQVKMVSLVKKAFPVLQVSVASQATLVKTVLPAFQESR